MQSLFIALKTAGDQSRIFDAYYLNNILVTNDTFLRDCNIAANAVNCICDTQGVNLYIYLKRGFDPVIAIDELRTKYTNELKYIIIIYDEIKDKPEIETSFKTDISTSPNLNNVLIFVGNDLLLNDTSITTLFPVPNPAAPSSIIPASQALIDQLEQQKKN